MANKETVYEWVQFAETDLKTAEFLFETMEPQPLAIICFHCQQSAEKMLKGILAAYDVEIKKTHDIGALAEELQTYTPVSDELIDKCYNLTPYGVKVRYPQELYIEETHAKEALRMARDIFEWIDARIRELF